MIEETLLDAMEKMGKAIEHVQAQFLGVRTGRANASLVEKLQVEYYGAFVPLQQLASFQVPEARMLVVKPHDRGSIVAIERALQSSDLGLSPSNDGVVIRLNFPALTEERRKEFVKVVKNMAEEGRVTVRNIRRDARKVLETAQKDGDISQDDLDRAEKELEQITHTTVEAVDKAFSRKEQELLEV
ncbi:MAG: ribosome recycling factor [Ilumatobacteraceae bacterium]|nr:ribosome recycling factor [Actinomycetota bacterium]MDP4635203.1 ribosome recycling factor [Ilumatobacteraceae bacterium]HBZ62365.1 ribosome recycling factor [Acidimicrobium sp.]MDA2982933.1 ribosome recycling factor [Actinomycetota bacterium]MDA3042143.1 ribosome recycling factor [Actinomycetota bacterium]